MRRLVIRDLPFRQSSNVFQVRPRRCSPGQGFLRLLYREDWFHVLLRLRTPFSLLVLLLLWTLLVVIFAAIYAGIDAYDPTVSCGLGAAGFPISYRAAFAFSLETCTTVGYGLPSSSNAFFENCSSLQVAIYFQMVLSMLFNALLLSFVWSRLGRCETRGAQVLFGDKAVLRREEGGDGAPRYSLGVRIYDADSVHPIVEAHVRLYAVSHAALGRADRPGARQLRDVRMRPMRVASPDDDLGAVMMTSLPTSVLHHIDLHSPVCPPARRERGPEGGRVGMRSGFVTEPAGFDHALREVDSAVGGRDGLRCAVCGETYGTVANLVQHIRYTRRLEEHDDVPMPGSHQEIDLEAVFGDRSSSPGDAKEDGEAEGEENAGRTEAGGDTRIDVDPPAPWYHEFQKHLEAEEIEIICVAEAIEPVVSGTFQALQSYTAEDICYGADFAPCVMADSDADEPLSWADWLWGCLIGRSVEGRSMRVDLDSFHEVVKI